MEARHTWVLRNTGRGTFEDVTVASGFLAVRGDYPIAVGRPNWVATFGDVDGDGDLDVYSGIDTRTPPSVPGPGDTMVTVRETSELLLNDGNGVFSLTFPGDPLRRAGLEDVPSGAAFIDYDLDGHLDLWMSQGGLRAPLQDRLFKGGARGDFTDATVEAGLRTLDWDGATLGDLNAARGPHPRGRPRPATSTTMACPSCSPAPTAAPPTPSGRRPGTATRCTSPTAAWPRATPSTRT
ncbi:MAG: FG-GAP-like repeat-containing protein [bacterium]